MATHELKTWRAQFLATVAGVKLFEFRRNDRNYQEDDVLVLREYDPTTSSYSGRTCIASVTYVLRGGHTFDGGQFGVPDGFVVLGIQPSSARGVDTLTAAGEWRRLPRR